MPRSVKRGNRFNGNTTVVAQRRRHTDARYIAGVYTETWLKVPKALEWAVQPGQRFVAKVVNEGVLFAPEEAA